MVLQTPPPTCDGYAGYGAAFAAADAWLVLAASLNGGCPQWPRHTSEHVGELTATTHTCATAAAAAAVTAAACAVAAAAATTTAALPAASTAAAACAGWEQVSRCRRWSSHRMLCARSAILRRRWLLAFALARALEVIGTHLARRQPRTRSGLRPRWRRQRSRRRQRALHASRRPVSRETICTLGLRTICTLGLRT